jgi:DNA-directed RNA polymerase II subunit RPB3
VWGKKRCAGPDSSSLGSLGHRFRDNRECDCSGECYKCCVIFELNVKFELDENPGQVQKLVTSKDLKPLGYDEANETPDVLPCHFSNKNESENSHDEGILIVKLARGQEVRMRCVAILGIGKQHAKWSPVTVCSFMCEPVITLNKNKLDNLSNEERSIIRDSCPVGVFGETNNLPNQALVVKHVERCMYCQECELRCVDISGKVDHDILAVTRNDKKFIFSVETTGALPPEDVVQQALHVIRKKLINLQTEIQEKLEEDHSRFDVSFFFFFLTCIPCKHT